MMHSDILTPRRFGNHKCPLKPNQENLSQLTQANALDAECASTLAL